MTTASQYAAFVRSLLIELTHEGVLQRQSRPFEAQIDRGNRRGYFLADDPGLLFVDQAVLRLEERFVVDATGNIQREKYTYTTNAPAATTSALSVNPTMMTSCTSPNTTCMSCGVYPISPLQPLPWKKYSR